ncbi:putative lysine-specific demethylase JMJ16 [Bidens hawaiensis]|uniref:putative lysine-specific demethylase JMJ16 n=1 Tax=Bidens hawaiensis TaxID=980011 RepID=UPI00404A702D
MMGTKFIMHHVKEESIDIPSIPPGFESFAAVSLKRVDDIANGSKSNSSVSTSPDPQPVKKEAEVEPSNNEKIKRSVRPRPGINYGRLGCSSGDESDSEQNQTSSTQMSKGVIRGCEMCHNCQKVIARWRPEEARLPDLLEAPVFYPTEEEFGDTLKYISSIRDKAEAYGICRIVPPPSWKPPCALKDNNSIWENSTFATRVQRVDKLQKRGALSQMLRSNFQKKGKRRRDQKTHGSETVAPVELVVREPDFGFEPGPRFTLKEFHKYADDFKNQYFRRNETVTDASGDSVMKDREPSLENIEGEYWRMIERPSEEIEVLYGADLETGTFGSGFPKEAYQVAGSDTKYTRSGWNLNNLPRLQGSLLTYESSDISGVLVPWLYIGMCFSSFCWHVEDHHLYSMNYMHFGAPKMWYGVPGKDAIKLEAAMRKHLPDLFAEQPDLLHKLVTQLSPSILKSEGVPVYRCVQNPGEFILTFPRAYHSGFNCGFNCAEAVNVAPVDWLPHGHNAIELYREQARKTSISHDKLLLGAARDAVKAHWELNLLRKHTPDNLRWKDVCGKNGILTQTLKARVEIERVRRDFLCYTTQALKMEAGFDATNERECSVCFFDLHLSAAGCRQCSPDKYSCLNHAKQFCSCAWGSKFFLLRHDIKDLAILVEALEGKLSAIYRWAKLDLGLSLSSYVSKDNKQPGSVSEPPTEEQKGQETVQDLLKSKESSRKDVILLSDDEGDDSSKPLKQATKSEVQVKNDSDSSHKPQDLMVTKGSGTISVELPKNDEKVVIIGLYAKSGQGKNTQTNPGKQKGPRIAKVVRRISCNVEPLEYGVVQSRKLWCDNRAIYPKGFKSRVKYINVLDPTDSCYYLSEIVDAGKNRPLFMVSLEKDPSETFIHFSPVKCWEMIRERVNSEISKKHKLKVPNLPPLQPPGSLDGMEMFGFSSPSILQGILSMDTNRVCTDYWESRPFHSQSHNKEDTTLKIQEPNIASDSIISGLFKKASLEELNAFLSVLNNEGSTSSQQEVAKLLNDEILKRPG